MLIPPLVFVSHNPVKDLAMKHLALSLGAAATVLLSPAAFADWYTVTVKNMVMKTNSTEPAPGPRIIVYGTFSPALPCAAQAFMVLRDDPLFQETYAMILTAQHTGTPIQYEHIYCSTDGVSRGSNYATGP
jgi:hypothetical protein